MQKLKIESSVIVGIFDNGGATLYRYTIILDDQLSMLDTTGDVEYDALGVAEDPKDFSQFTRAKAGSHLGKEISWHDLPIAVNHHLLERLKDEA